jgi:CRP-like cAMP-binding protein
VDRDGFELLRRERPGVERFLVEAMAFQVRFLTARADDLVDGSAERRVLRRLLELAYVFGAEAPVMVPLAQDDLAAVAGVTRSTVNRVLRTAAQHGWVGLGWRRLLVLDPPAIFAALQAMPADAGADVDVEADDDHPLAGEAPGDQPGGSSPMPA